MAVPAIIHKRLSCPYPPFACLSATSVTISEQIRLRETAGVNLKCNTLTTLGFPSPHPCKKTLETDRYRQNLQDLPRKGQSFPQAAPPPLGESSQRQIITDTIDPTSALLQGS